MSVLHSCEERAVQRRCISSRTQPSSHDEVLDMAPNVQFVGPSLQLSRNRPWQTYTCLRNLLDDAFMVMRAPSPQWPVTQDFVGYRATIKAQIPKNPHHSANRAPARAMSTSKPPAPHVPVP